MGAGGTFLRVLAAGTLAVVMAAVTPPPDHYSPSPTTMDPDDPRCDVPDVTVIDGQPARIAASNETASMTLYFHVSKVFDALRYDVVTDRGRGVMWQPYSWDCIVETDGWYEALLYCEAGEETDLVTCSYKVKACRSFCLLDLRSSGHISFSVTAYGHSLWRRAAPPQGCRVHEIIPKIFIGTMKCHDNPFEASTPTMAPTTLPFKGPPSPTTGAPPSTTGAQPRTTGVPPGTTGTPPGTTGTPPGTTGTPPGTTGTPPRTTGAPPRTTGVPPGTTGAPPRTTGVPPGTTWTPPGTTGAPPGTTGTPPGTTGAPPGTTPLTSAVPDRNCSGVELEVQIGAVVYVC